MHNNKVVSHSIAHNGYGLAMWWNLKIARNRSPIKIQKMKLTNKSPGELRPPKLLLIAI